MVSFPVGAAITIDNYDTDVNDRFQDGDSPDQFLLQNFDLSGIGMDSTGKWATLIGSNTILSANHFQPSGTITFYPGNDPAATPVEIGLSTDSLRISDGDGGTDLWIARLADFAPTSLTPLSYATTPISEPQGNSGWLYKDEPAYMVGRSEGSFPNTQDQAFGTNVISGFQENVSGANLGDSVDALELSYDTGGTDYEAVVQSGDSGAPLLYDDGSGNLLVLGINSFQLSSSGDPIGTGVNYTGNNADQIDAQVQEWAAIPEPVAAIPAGVAMFFLVLVRRYHSSDK